YHRPPLSKEYLRGDIGAAGTYGAGGVFAQLPPWYAEQRVGLRTGVAVTRLDPAARRATLSDGAEISYHRALLATGARPRTLPIPGATLPGVYALRSLDDSTAIREQLVARRNVVVIGSGFIGLEGASNALARGAQVAIVDPVERVWPGMLTPDLSDYLAAQYTRRGATFHLNHAPTEFVAGADGRLAAVTIAPFGGAAGATVTLPAEIAIVGVGVKLNTDLATEAGLNVDPRHGVMVDDHLRASVEGVFAAGDVAAYVDPVMGRYHFEHWDNAIASGRTAGMNMSGGDEHYQHVPYFFSDQFDLSINMLGYPSPDDEVILRGDPATDAFTAVYIRDGAIRAALMVNDDAQMDTWRELIEAAAAPPADRERLADRAVDPASFKRA
ncbi:MAG: FAD-dependent oxidoreductase, partial [Chloroflexota bacterium]|nr:FAD-dependent oxidoreductase [Chloroflexota bacterium]